LKNIFDAEKGREWNLGSSNKQKAEKKGTGPQGYDKFPSKATGERVL